MVRANHLSPGIGLGKSRQVDSDSIVDGMMHMQVILFHANNMYRISVTKLSNKALHCQYKILLHAE